MVCDGHMYLVPQWLGLAGKTRAWRFLTNRVFPLTGNSCPVFHPWTLLELPHRGPRLVLSNSSSFSPFTDHRPYCGLGKLLEAKLELGLPGWPGKKAFHVEVQQVLPQLRGQRRV